MKRYLLPRKANNDDRPVTSTTTSSRQIEKLKVTLQAEIHTHSLNTHVISPAQNPSKKRKTTSHAVYDDQEITVLEEGQAVLLASPSTAPNAILSDVRPSMASTSHAEGTRQTDFKLGCLSKVSSDDRRLVDVESKDDIDDDAIVPKDTTALTSWPNCWTLDQWKYFKSANDWLFAIGGNLGCSVCKAVSCLGPSRTNAGMKTKLPAEWINGTVAPGGATLAAQLSSLRKKMFLHKNSFGHNEAFSVFQAQGRELLKTSVVVQSAEHHLATTAVFRTAYYIAKQDRPYSDHPHLLDLQKMNGVNVGRVLHSNVVCSDIIDHIALDMKQALVKHIVTSKPLFSILIDESTNLNRISCLVVYIRCTLNLQAGPITFFFDIVPLGEATANGITSALLKCLQDQGISMALMAECLIGLGVDGASVMLGEKGGVVAKLREHFPSLISWHCFNHRLELSVHDAVKSCTEINHFKIFLDSLYALYSMSPKAQRELTAVAGELNVQLIRIGRVLDVRWVASSCRSVRAVWQSYSALYKHFSNRSASTKKTDSEQPKFYGMIRKLANPVFIKNLGLMYDALEELADLSLALQKADVTLPVAHRLLTRQIEVFAARKESNGHYYAEACQAVDAGTFKGVSVAASSGKEREIHRAQFYQALVDSMTKRLLADSEKDLCGLIVSLDPNAWPTDLTPEHGERELAHLCSRFFLQYTHVKQGYRDFKDSRGGQVSDEFQELLNRVNTLPVSTAECERGFSKMNIVCTSIRSQLSIEHISSLMFISLNGPPLEIWKPLPYVKSWLASHRRDATDTTCMRRMPASQQNKTFESLWHLL